MWLCTQLGFYSIVRKAADEIHVRARAKQDLLNLRKHLADYIGPRVRKWKIHRSEPADYRWRIVIRDVDMNDLFAGLSYSIDYSNFKGVISSRQDQRDKLPIYSDFHHDMERWQNGEDELRLPGGPYHRIDRLF